MVTRFFFLISLLMCICDYAISQDSGFEFQSNRRFVSVPIKVHHNLVIIPVRINDSPPLNFILDTGVNRTILTEPIIAHMLGLDIRHRIYIYGLGTDGILEANRAAGVTLEVESLKGSDMDLIVLPEGVLSFSEIFGFPVYGIIGHDLFKNFPIQINYISEQARIYKEPSYHVPRRARVIPLQITEGKPYVKTKAIGNKGDTIITSLLVDLGASHPIYLNQDHLNLTPKTLKGFLGKGIGGSLLGRIGRLDRLIISDQISIELPIVAFPDQRLFPVRDNEFTWEGIIGGGILSRFNIIIDYPSGQMLLVPNQKYGDPFSFNPSGLEIIANGPDFRDYIIYYVRPGSPAYEAGIMAGDKIMSLNSVSSNSLTLQIIQQELTGESSRIISMVVLREPNIIRTRFKLRNDI